MLFRHKDELKKYIARYKTKKVVIYAYNIAEAYLKAQVKLGVEENQIDLSRG
jgi:hypothetical protein